MPRSTLRGVQFTARVTPAARRRLLLARRMILLDHPRMSWQSLLLKWAASARLQVRRRARRDGRVLPDFAEALDKPLVPFDGPPARGSRSYTYKGAKKKPESDVA